MASSIWHARLVDGLASCFGSLACTDSHMCYSSRCIDRLGFPSYLWRRCGSVPSVADAMVFSFAALVAAVGDIFGLMAN